MRGNAHKYGKNVDTDVIIPGKYCNISIPRNSASTRSRDSIRTIRRR